MNERAKTTNPIPAPAKKLAPQQAENLLNNVMEKMEKLIVLFDQEQDSLVANDMRKFNDAQPEKLRLIRDCEMGVAEIQSQKEALDQCNPVLKDRLLSTHTMLSDIAEQSKRTYEARANSMKRIQERLLEAARTKIEQDSKHYGRNGKTAPKTKPIATAINEAI